MKGCGRLDSKSETIIPWGQPLLRRGPWRLALCCLRSRVGHSSGTWVKERSLTELWCTNILFLLIMEATVQPTIDEAKKGNLESLCLASR